MSSRTFAGTAASSPLPGRAVRAVVIGAGPCGLTTFKNLLTAGHANVECYDAADSIGGNWVFREQPSHSSIYETVHLISSKWLSAFEDFPMPSDYPNFPSHRQMLAYFQAYAEHFNLLPHIQLSTRVERARRTGDGRWRLTLAHPGGSEHVIADALFICTGHHSDPVLPDLPGHFSGEFLHSHEYKRTEPFRGKRVLVIGGGNSACDIAAATARVSAFTAISMRQGYHILPRSFFGVPSDILFWQFRLLPKPVRQRIAQCLTQLLIGPPQQYGLLPPAHRLLEIHPTLNSSILDALRRGEVQARRGIENIDGQRVRFADGREETFDTIIAATGYRINFPFLEEPFSTWDSADPPPLYLRMMPADIPNLYFIGLVQPAGSIWPLADLQAQIAALHVSGQLALPRDLEARIAREQSRRHFRYHRTPRHALEVDYYTFRKTLLREIAKAAPHEPQRPVSHPLPKTTITAGQPARSGATLQDR